MPAAPTHQQIDEEYVVEGMTFEHDILPHDVRESVALRRLALRVSECLESAIRSGERPAIQSATEAVALVEQLQQWNRAEDSAHISLVAMSRLHRSVVVIDGRDLPPAA